MNHLILNIYEGSISYLESVHTAALPLTPDPHSLVSAGAGQEPLLQPPLPEADPLTRRPAQAVHVLVVSSHPLQHAAAALEADYEDEAELAAQRRHLGVVRVTRGGVHHLLPVITDTNIVTHLDVIKLSLHLTLDHEYLRGPKQSPQLLTLHQSTEARDQPEISGSVLTLDSSEVLTLLQLRQVTRPVSHCHCPAWLSAPRSVSSLQVRT